MSEEGIAVHVKWVANPGQADRFEEIWLPAAEAVLDYGATGWAFFRAKDGLHDFAQWSFVPAKDHFDRYWYSDEIGEVRAKAVGTFQVPLLPTYHYITGMGSLAPSMLSPIADAAPADETA